MNLCINCKHHKKVHFATGNEYLDWLNDQSWFKEKENACSYEGSVDPVDGKAMYHRCKFARSDKGHCKPEGIHYEENR